MYKLSKAEWQGDMKFVHSVEVSADTKQHKMKIACYMVPKVKTSSPQGCPEFSAQDPAGRRAECNLQKLPSDLHMWAMIGHMCVNVHRNTKHMHIGERWGGERENK